MKAKSPTIKDVALIAGVSIGTVDRVLHDRGRVSDESKRAVLAAVETLNFKPSNVARALATQKNRVRIGITFPFVEKDFWVDVSKGIARAEQELGPYGVEITCLPSKTYKLGEQMDILQSFCANDLNGIVFVPVDNSKLKEKIDEISQAGIAMATFISDVPLSKRLFFVGQDDVRSGTLAGRLVELFLKGEGSVSVLRGQRNIRCIQQRITGFVEKIETECPNIDISGFYDLNEYDEKNYNRAAYNAAINCIQTNPDINAIYVTNGLTEWAAEAVQDCKKQGQIVVIGHEYTEGIGKYLRKDIVGATICQKPSEEAYLSIKMLYENISGKRSSENDIFRVGTDIFMKENNPV